MIKSAVRNYLINVFALWVCTQYIGGFILSEGWKSLLIVGLGFTILHFFIKPILSLFLGPINFLTLGLVDLVVDSGLLYALTYYFPQVSISAWRFPGVISQYLTLPAYDLNFIMVTVLSALVINMIRSLLCTISSS